MKTTFQYMRIFLAGLWKGVLGIYIEVLFTAAIILTGFLICVFWWGIYQ